LPARPPIDSVARVLERVPRREPESERPTAPRPAPLPPSILAAGNAAVGRAVLARNTKQWKREATDAGVQNDNERNLYVELRQQKFTTDQIEVAGPGTPNADLLAYDGKRLWIVEVKGHTDWLSRDNQRKKGNVPLKQLSNKLRGQLGKEIQISKVDMTIEDALENPGTAGRRPIKLVVTNLDTADALLMVEQITDDEGDRHATYSATTVNEVIRFFDDVLERYSGSSENEGQLIQPLEVDVREMVATWRKGIDADGFFTTYGPKLERAYTTFRKAMAHTRQQFAEFEKLDADLDVRLAFVPVVNSVSRMARRAVLARTRFKGAEDGMAWLELAREALPREETEDDDSWITRLLLADEEYGGEDFSPNYGVLVKALAKPVVQVRQAPKGTRKRVVDATMWNHIVNGVVSVEGIGAKKTPTEKITGLHTIHGDRPAAEGFGPKTMVGSLGCYKQSVRSIQQAQQKNVESREKRFQSTFYPDDWTLEDIREAIEYASQRGKEYEVMSPQKGVGLTLFFNGESYYPNYR
jgi:hypothetical protein